MSKKLLNKEIYTPKEYEPDIAIHPGESLKEEMDFLGVTVSKLSKKTGEDSDYIQGVLKGQESITESFAKEIEDSLGTPAPASFWYGLQKRYDRDIVRIEKQKNQKVIYQHNNLKPSHA